MQVHHAPPTIQIAPFPTLLHILQKRGTNYLVALLQEWQRGADEGT